MSVSKSKRRYNVTIRPEIVTRFRELARSLGMPSIIMSTVCENAIKEISDVFQIAKEKGTLDVDDMKRLMQKQIDIFEEEKLDVKQAPENSGMAKKHKTKKRFIV